MGHSGAYRGSGGRRWPKVREQAGNFADNPSDANAEQLLNEIANALDWDGDPDNAPAPGEAPGPLRPNFGALRISTPSGTGDGPGGLGGGRGRADGGGGGSGSGRSRARAARVGGSVAAAGLALRNRDDGTLQFFNLTLAELDALDSYEQAKRILNAVGASLGDLQEEELVGASAAALLALLANEGTTGADAVRIFVVEYVFGVSLTEIGDQFRNGTRDGWASVEYEDKLRDLVEASAAQIDLPENLSSDEIQAAVYTALDDARTYMRAER